MPESSEKTSERETETVEALKAFDFGQLIAFILPGLVATRGLALLMPSLQKAFDRITDPTGGALGPLVWLLLVASTIGLTISVTRQQWLDPIFGWIYGCSPKWLEPFFDWVNRCFRKEPKDPTEQVKRGPWRVNYKYLRRNEKAQALFGKAIREVYRYYQFITNIAIAVAIDAGCLWRAAQLPPSPTPPAPSSAPQPTGPPFALLRWVATGLSLFLLFTAYQQFKGWCRVHNQITSPDESEGSSKVSTA